MRRKISRTESLTLSVAELIHVSKSANTRSSLFPTGMSLQEGDVQLWGIEAGGFVDSLSNPQEDQITTVCPLIDEPYVLLGCASGKLRSAALLGSSGSPAGGAREACSLQKLPYDGEPAAAQRQLKNVTLHTHIHCQSKGNPRLCGPRPGHDSPSASAVSPESMAGARGSIVALACSTAGNLHQVILVHSASSPLVWDLRQAPDLESKDLHAAGVYVSFTGCFQPCNQSMRELSVAYKQFCTVMYMTLLVQICPSASEMCNACRYKSVVVTTEAVLLPASAQAEPAPAAPRKMSWLPRARAQAAEPEQDAATCACWLGSRGDLFAVGYTSGVVRLYSIPDAALGATPS